MRDKKRHTVFAKFCDNLFSGRVKTILAVADGKGELARVLADMGYEVRVIEADPRFAGREHTHITYEKGWFTENTPITEDAVVALHPDEATSEVLLAAKKQGKPFALVPCCVLGRYSAGINGRKNWIKKLISLYPCSKTMLKMTGKNVVLYKQ